MKSSAPELFRCQLTPQKRRRPPPSSEVVAEEMPSASPTRPRSSFPASRVYRDDRFLANQDGIERRSANNSILFSSLENLV